jgi:hypothetical protein
MIDLNNFEVGSKKVNHSLINNWTWEKIEQIVSDNTEINPQYYRDLGNGGYTLGAMHRNDYCMKVLEYLHLNKPEYHPRAGLYVSTKSDSKTFSRHSDPGQYLWVWQLIGETKWVVEDKEYILKPNEVLYISEGLMHEAIPDSPRASITFSLEKYE